MERSKTRPKRLAPSGRAHTCQVSLTPAQAAWLASRGCPASAVLRQLVEREMWHDAEEAKRKEGTPVGPLVIVA
jgi:hypothetical protein